MASAGSKYSFTFRCFALRCPTFVTNIRHVSGGSAAFVGVLLLLSMSVFALCIRQLSAITRGVTCALELTVFFCFDVLCLPIYFVLFLPIHINQSLPSSHDWARSNLSLPVLALCVDRFAFSACSRSVITGRKCGINSLSMCHERVRFQLSPPFFAFFVRHFAPATGHQDGPAP